nr:lysophospholipid acyltransferase family protein [bacterium]
SSFRAEMSAGLLKTGAATTLTAALASGLIRMVGRSSDWEFHNREELEKVLESPGRAIFAFWHNRFMMMPYIYRRFLQPGRRISVIVSRSRDGELLSRLIGAFGLHSVRGSSTRGGRAAFVEIVRDLAAGGDAAVTPDGPKGPRYQVHEGVIAIAAVTGLPILPVSFASTLQLVIAGSWDHMRIPLPLGRIRVVFGPAIEVPRAAAGEERSRWAEVLRRSLRAVDRRAERGASASEK